MLVPTDFRATQLTNGVAWTFGALGILAPRYAHKIPFIVKFHHNELLTCPNKHD